MAGSENDGSNRQATGNDVKGIATISKEKSEIIKNITGYANSQKNALNSVVQKG